MHWGRRRFTIGALGLAGSLAAGATNGSAAQQVAVADRGPRFLYAATATAIPQPVDVKRTPMLRQQLSLDLNGASVAQALGAITRQTGLRFVYSREVIPPESRVHLRAEQITVAAALTEILIDAGVDVLLSNLSQAALVKRTKREVLQPGSVAGRVTDAETGAGLAAAEVFLEGTRWRTLADGDGRFRLAEVEAGSHTLVARRIGYGRQSRSVTVAAGQESSVDFALDPTPTKLEEVVVTGTVVPTEVKALPTPVDVVTAADIEQQQIRRTDQIFRLFVPSAVAWDLGTAPEQTAITIRGASSFKGGTGVKIYVDGVEVTSTTFTLIDPNSIERVEIIRGPQAATIYGPEAIGGVMQVFTKKGDPALGRPEFEAQASAGLLESEFKDGGTLRQEYEAGLRGGGASFGYNLGASYGRTGEWLPEFRLRTPSVYGGARFTHGPVSLELTSRYFATHQNAANQPRLVQAGLASPLPRHEELHTRLSTYGAHLGYTPFSWWRHSLTVGTDRFSASDFNTRPRLRTPDDTFLTVISRESGKTSVAYNTSATAPLAEALSAVLTTGFDHFTTEDDAFVAPLARNFEGNINTEPSVPITAIRGPTRNTGYFAQTQLNLRDALFLTGGLRVDQNTIIGDEDPVSPRVGIAYNHPLGGTTVKLRVAYGEAIRAPQAIDRLGLDFGFVRFLPSLDLRAERQKGVDAGVDLAWGAALVSATYYRQTAEDLIQDVFVGVDTVNSVPIFQSQNVGRVRNTGLELQAALPVGGVQLTGNYAYTSSKVLELSPGFIGDLLPGDQVLEIPKHTAAATIAVTPFRGTIVASGLTYVGKRTSYDNVAQIGGTCAGRDCFATYPEFLKANLSVTQTLTPKISALFAVENLTNNNTGEQFDFLPSLGRITTVGVRARW